MLTGAIKLLLLFFGMIFPIGEISPTLSVAVVLITLTLTALNQYFGYLGFKYIIATISIAYFALSLFYPAFSPFMPIFCFDLAMNGRKSWTVFAVIPIIPQLTTRPMTDNIFLFLLPKKTQEFRLYHCYNT